MSHDDRIQNAFDDLRQQTADLAPPALEQAGESLSRRRNLRRNAWVPAVAAAAVIILAVGGIALLGGGSDEPPVGATDPTTTTSAPATTATTVVSIESGVTTSMAAITTTTTTTPATIALPPLDGPGWRVVGVVAGDVLNVRSCCGPDHPIVGTLAHDDVGVQLTGTGSTGFDGSGWWGVLLEDGTEGFVNSRFLAPPAGWYQELDFECSEIPADGPGDHADNLDGWDPSSNATGIIGFAHLQVGDCDRYVIALGSGAQYEPPVEADHVPGGISVTARSGEVIVDFSGAEAVRGVDATASNASFDAGLLITSVPGGDDPSLAPRVHVFSSEGRLALSGVHFFSDPARVVVDVVGAGEGSPDLRLPHTGLTVLTTVTETGDGVTVRGFARWFEAQGFAQVFDGAGAAVSASWSGDSVWTESPTELAGIYAPWAPTWGEFEFTVGGLPDDGNYTLFVGEECLVDEAYDTWEPCGMTIPFTTE